MRMMMLSANEAKKLRPGLFTGLLLVIGIVLVQLIQLGLNMALTQDAYYLSKSNPSELHGRLVQRG